MPTAPRRYLVIVRAGEQSLHPAWLGGADRSWDLFVSWYGDAAYSPVADERVAAAKGGKWNVLCEQFAAFPELLGAYDYFWIPDDDIQTDSATIDGLFRIAAAEGLPLCQPSLTPDSYFSYVHTVQSPSFRLRYTTFVEIMAPCMSRQALLRVIPHARQSTTGFGLNRIWALLEDDNRHRAAIIDAVAVRHTRPIGKFLAARARAGGIEPKAEGEAVDRRFGISGKRREPYCYGGIARRGAYRGQLSSWVHMLIDYLASSSRWVEPRAWKLFKRCFNYPWRRVSLSKLEARN